jgi:hypothetical protein
MARLRGEHLTTTAATSLASQVGPAAFGAFAPRAALRTPTLPWALSMPSTQVPGLQPRLWGSSLELHPGAGSYLGTTTQPVTSSPVSPRQLIASAAPLAAHVTLAPVVAARL